MLILFGYIFYNCGIELVCCVFSLQCPIFLALVSVQQCPNWISKKYYFLQVLYPFLYFIQIVLAIFVYLKQLLAFHAVNIVYILLFADSEASLSEN